MVKHSYIKCSRIQDAKGNKRLNDIRLLAIEVLKYAKKVNKPLVIEKLNIDNSKNSYRKFNRIKHNFIYRKIIEAVLARGIKDEVAIKEVEPAFTSILGNLKYKDMYSLNRHTAAALVIARRGMNIKEKQTFSVTQVQKTDKKTGTNKVMWNLEGRYVAIDLSQKSWSWLSGCFLKAKLVTHTESHLDQMGIRCSVGEISTDESTTITGRCGSINNTVGAERSPCKIA
jgi:IS605 OrfB family transposase